MKCKGWLMCCALLTVHLAPLVVKGEKVVVCYMASWAVNRQAEGKFTVLDSDTEHCTHVIYAFMGLDKDTNRIKSIDPYIDLPQNGRGKDQLGKLKRLKESNPRIKVLVSVGGKEEKSRKFSDMARDPEARAVFIGSVLSLLRKHELDGLDFCWQFPGLQGGRPEDKENSVILFQELKEAFRPEGYLLTVHILGKKYILEKYDLAAVSRTVDLINLMPMEFNGPWNRITGVNAPLRAKDLNSVQFSVDFTLRSGARPDKMTLGLMLHGHAYILEEKPSPQRLLGLYSIETFREPWTNDRGIIGYHEICHNFKYTSGVNTAGWRRVWDEDSQTPLAYKENDKLFVSYDDKESFLLKADLVEAKSLAGVAFWAMDTDDFRGLCFGNKFPMISAVTDYINHRNVSQQQQHVTTTPSLGLQTTPEDTDDLGPPDA